MVAPVTCLCLRLASSSKSFVQVHDVIPSKEFRYGLFNLMRPNYGLSFMTKLI